MPFKERHAKNERVMYLYLLLGLVIVLILAIILGILVHFALALVMIVLYIGGLIYLIRRNSKENDTLLRKIHFNVCLALRNENERLFSRYNIRARVGYLSQWIEFHAISPYGTSFGGGTCGLPAVIGTVNPFSLALHSHDGLDEL